MERTQPLQKTFPGATARASRRKRRLAPSFQAQACASADKRRQAPSLEAQAPSSAGNPPPRRASRFTLRIYITVGSCLPPFSLVSSCATPNEERSAEGRHQQEFKEEGTQEQQRVALAGACRRFAG